MFHARSLMTLVLGIFSMALFLFMFSWTGSPEEVTHRVPSVTVVTAYYDIPSKRSKSFYMKMMANFLPHIPCNLYIFTDAANYPMLSKLRAAHIQRTKFIVREFKQLTEAKRMKLWKDQHKVDPERSYHTPQLYIVWHEKTHMVADAIRDNAFDSGYFIWCDIGSFRSPELVRNLTGFPNFKKTTEILKNHMKMTMLLLQPLPNTSYSIGSNELPTTDFWKANWIGGTILAGHKDAWSIWSKTYYSTIDLMLQNGLFVGKDQSVMNVAMAKSPNQFNLVLPQPYFDGKGDQWFYLQYYFS